VLYRKLLCMFRDRESDFASRFNAARAHGDAPTALRMAHDLKSTAATLAVHGVQEAASALEEACDRSADAEDIDLLMQNLTERLEPVVAALQALDAAPAA
jgi:HPt (histidine-containing phosphotransfer) domain-containing protein